MTNGICSSLWIVKLETYQGALVTERKNLDWSLWIIFVFDDFVQPHNCISYVHLGFIMHLYSGSLLGEYHEKLQNMYSAKYL
jgi:hypothetical protein